MDSPSDDVSDDLICNAVVRQQSKPSRLLQEPIAITGIRLPGKVTSCTAFWDFLLQKRSAQSGTPLSRYNVHGFYHPNANRPGTFPISGGYYLDEDLSTFDNAFFGISNLEATYMDPQQKKLLEVTYECFESAGVTLNDVAGANIGCYVGNFTNDYSFMQVKDIDYLNRLSATGMGLTIMSNRISHAFDLRGPSLTVDTACSSSLYCLHLACQELDKHGCDAVIVAGANLIQTPESQMSAARTGVLSETSACHTFDASADGYGRGEGVGALLLKRLSDAIQDNDPIRSIIRGTAANSDGKTTGITLPSPNGQVAVMNKAYLAANLDPADTTYVECHGTGTPVGDPIEVEAVYRFFRSSSCARLDRPLLIGSVKPNFGHSEAVSGISSIVKATLALEHRHIPPTRGVKELNPNIPWENYQLKVAQSSMSWPAKTSSSIPNRASINSFGYGGSNAHCILEDPRHSMVASRSCCETAAGTLRPFLLPASATSTQALTSRFHKLKDMIVAQENVQDLAYTLGERRTHFSYRSFVVAFQNAVLDESTGYIEAHPKLLSSKRNNRPYVFIFTGQGAQWLGMGKELFECSRVFRNSIKELEAMLSLLSHGPEWNISEYLLGFTELDIVDKPSRAQTVCTAVQIALVDLLRDWNIVPRYVVGHSSGEIAAAYTARHISSTAAISVAYYRGYLAESADTSGAMSVVGCSHDQLREEIEYNGLSAKLNIACVNSPESTTVSGNVEAIDLLQEKLSSAKIFNRRLRTAGIAYHSPHMQRIGQTYEDSLKYVFTNAANQNDSSSASSEVEMISSVLGRLIGKEEISQAAYWRKNLESPVLFSDAISLLPDKYNLQFIEIGPHPTLALPTKQTVDIGHPSGDRLHYLAALYRNRNSAVTSLSLAGSLWMLGHDIPFNRVNFQACHCKRNVLHHLHEYEWDHSEPTWIEGRHSQETRFRSYRRDELLGLRTSSVANKSHTWRNLLSVSDVPWLKDHAMENVNILPATGFIVMACKAAQQVFDDSGFEGQMELHDIHIQKALVLPQSEQVEIFTELTPRRITSIESFESWWDFKVLSHSNEVSIQHASGLVGFQPNSEWKYSSPLSWPYNEVQSMKAWYRQTDRKGSHFGPSFQIISNISFPRMRDKMISEACLRDFQLTQGEPASQYTFDVHPVLADALLQNCTLCRTRGDLHRFETKIPVFIKHVQLKPNFNYQDTGSCNIRTSAKEVAFGIDNFQTELYGPDGTPLIKFNDVRIITHKAAGGHESRTYPILYSQWIPHAALIHHDNLGRLPERLQGIQLRTTSEQSKCSRNLVRLALAMCKVDPQSRILEVSTSFTSKHKVIEEVESNLPFKIAGSVVTLRVDSIGRISTPKPQDDSFATGNVNGGKRRPPLGLFDIIIYNGYLGRDNIHDYLSSFVEHSSDRTKVLFVPRIDEMYEDSLWNIATIKGWQDEGDIGLAWKKPIATSGIPKGPSISNKIVMLVDDENRTFNGALESALAAIYQRDVSIQTLDSITEENIPQGSHVIVTTEISKPMLCSLSAQELRGIHCLTNHASQILWIIHGNLLGICAPNLSPVFGLARAISMEQPSLSFSVLDLDTITEDIPVTLRNITLILTSSGDPTSDREYVQRNGIIGVNRIAPWKIRDDHSATDEECGLAKVPLSQTNRVRLSIEEPGQMDTLHYEEMAFEQQIPSESVEVSVRAVGINAKDLYTLSGKIDTQERTCSLEFTGVINRVGDRVTTLCPSDRVVVAAPSHFASFERVPYWACHKIHSEESFTDLSAASVAFMTALHALRDKARLQHNETVLIHSGAGGVGLAAIRLAHHLGAIVFATAGTQAKREYIAQNCDVRLDHIFDSRNTSFLEQIKQATNGRGVDIVLNSLTGSRLHASLEACAPWGRFVEIGKRDILDSGSLNMSVFARSLTVTAFDLSDMFYAGLSDTWQRLLIDAIEHFRRLRTEPPTVFDASQVTSAFRTFGNLARVGKVCVSFENKKDLLPVSLRDFTYKFNAHKTYLLVGCLGGIGRSLSRHMWKQGARHFVFIGRSGTSKHAARDLVEDLERGGAEVQVFRGDVQDFHVVDRAVQSIRLPLGGVIQAAMGLSESLFSSMTAEKWHAALGPKIKGTWNLHNAIRGQESGLEFFLMTSSLSGSIGAATESNYCAANAFLDHFAAYRRSLDLCATSIGLGAISGIGYLYEHSDIEEMLLRKGLSPISEFEFLKICDAAFTDQHRNNQGSDTISRGHLLTGLKNFEKTDAFTSQLLDEQNRKVMYDPRLSVLAKMASESSSGSLPEKAESSYPSSVSAVLNTADRQQIEETVAHSLIEKLSKMTLTPIGRLSGGTSPSEIGIDSMLAAELRTFIYRCYKTDVSVLALLDSNTSIIDLAKIITHDIR